MVAKIEILFSLAVLILASTYVNCEKASDRYYNKVARPHSVLSSFEALVLSYMNARTGNYGSSGGSTFGGTSSSTMMLLTLAVGVPLLLILAPLLLGPILALFGLTGLTGMTGMTGMTGVTGIPTVVGGRRRKRSTVSIEHLTFFFGGLENN